MPILLVEPSGVNLHNTGALRSVPQFRRSKVPGINVVLSGVRVNAPSDPVKLNKGPKQRKDCMQTPI